MGRIKSLGDNMEDKEKDFEEQVTKHLKEIKEFSNSKDRDSYNQYIIELLEYLATNLKGIEGKVITVELVEAFTQSRISLGTVSTNQNIIHSYLIKQFQIVKQHQEDMIKFMKSFKKIFVVSMIATMVFSYTTGVLYHEDIKPYIGKIIDFGMKN